jgi:hypothetical protein
MQQRFSSNEIKKEGKPAKPMSTSDMLTHTWILTADDSTKSGKKNPKAGDVTFKVKLKLSELLNVSSDWKEVNKKNGVGSGLSVDF